MQPETVRNILKTLYLYRTAFVVGLGFIVVLLAVGLVMLVRSVFFTPDAGQISDEGAQTDSAEEMSVDSEEGEDAVVEFPEMDIESPFEGEGAPDQTETIEIPARETDREYVVVAGDTLWDLSEQYYDDGLQYHLLAELNSIENPDLIFVDQVLQIPDTPFAKNQTKGSVASDSSVMNSQDSYQEYEIKPGDSLWKIVKIQLNNEYLWPEIYQLNAQKIGGNPNLIYPATTILLPDQGSTQAPSATPPPSQ
ncbi:MAG: LysM peptidoglycan-binding domain-containing protein [Patescibacteria group bacterium]